MATDGQWVMDRATGAIPPVQAAVSAICSALATKVRAIRNDLGLNDQGRVSAIATAYVDARQQVLQLRASADAAEDAGARQALRRLLGLSASDMLSWRDATERAEQLASEGDAVSLLERCSLTGDELLAKAVLVSSLDRGWSAAIDAYVVDNPAASPAVDAYLASQAQPSPQQRLADSIAFSVPKPAEISVMDDWKIANLARGSAA